MLQWPTMKLCEALGLQLGEVVTFVGAGGKTTAIWRAQAELVADGGRVVATTTTKIMEPALPHDGALMLTAEPDAARLTNLLDRAPRLTLAARRLGAVQPLHADHPVPSRPFKLDGLSREILDGLVAQLPGVTWLVEADGAKGCGLKIHAAHEPVVPASATTVVVMAHLDVLRQGLDVTTVHRVDDATRLLGVPVRTPLTPTLFARVLCDETSLQGVPERARVVALLTQRSRTLHPDALALADLLLQGQARYNHIVIAALRADAPVLTTVMR